MKIKKTKMDKDKFDMLWKIILLIILMIAIFYMFYEWKMIDKEGILCRSDPFGWGMEKANKSSISCTCFDFGKIG